MDVDDIVNRALRHRHDTFRDTAREAETFEITVEERRTLIRGMDGGPSCPMTGIGTSDERIFGMRLVVHRDTSAWDERRNDQVRDYALGRVPVLPEPNFVVDTWLHNGLRHRRRANGAVEVGLGDHWFPCRIAAHNSVRVR